MSQEAETAPSCTSLALIGKRAYLKEDPFLHLTLALSDIMAPLKIYWGSGSTPAWRVLVCMEEKGLSYESKLLEFSKSKSSHIKVSRVLPTELGLPAEERLLPYVIERAMSCASCLPHWGSQNRQMGLI